MSRTFLLAVPVLMMAATASIEPASATLPPASGAIAEHAPAIGQPAIRLAAMMTYTKLKGQKSGSVQNAPPSPAPRSAVQSSNTGGGAGRGSERSGLVIEERK